MVRNVVVPVLWLVPVGAVLILIGRPTAKPHLPSPAEFRCGDDEVAGPVAAGSEARRDSPSAVPFEGAGPGQERSDNGLSMRFRWCPPGEFRMGSAADETGRRDEEDQVEVRITDGFWLGTCEVVRDEWRRLAGTTPWSGEPDADGDPDRPATSVRWDDAVAFCRCLTHRERSAGRLPDGCAYRLPTEAEWEYACRAGSSSAYAFGDDATVLGEYARWGGDRHLEAVSDGARPLVPGSVLPDRVGRRLPNAWGFRDMHGNVHEWCGDFYLYRLAGGPDPRGPESGVERTLRGGASLSAAEQCRSASRWRFSAGFADACVGFRVALARDVR